jgi:hypothetical protein
MLQCENELFESRKLALFHKYGTPKENGNIEIGKENYTKFNEEFVELLSIENDYVFEKIKIGDLEGSKLSPADVLKLDILMEE